MAVTRDDVVEIIFTSGATAEPKGVVLTHRNVLANIVPVEKEIRKYQKYGRPFFPIRFPQPPAAESYVRAGDGHLRSPDAAGHGGVHARPQPARDRASGENPAHFGARLGAENSRRARRSRRAPVSRRAPRAGKEKESIPKRWWRYRAVHRLFGLKFWSFVVGAAPLESSLESFWGRLGFVVVQGYGLTETAPIVTLNHPFSTSKGSVGKPIAGVDVRVAPDGEILVRGENVTTGYYGAPETTDAAFEGGWFHTGDIGRARRVGPALHPRTQEGNDRHARKGSTFSRKTWSAPSTPCPASGIPPRSA